VDAIKKWGRKTLPLLFLLKLISLKNFVMPKTKENKMFDY